jgi:hypothetical protein
VPEPLKEEIKQILLQMHENPYGKEILSRMNIDFFIPAETTRELYEKTSRLLYPHARPTSAVHKPGDR